MIRCLFPLLMLALGLTGLLRSQPQEALVAVAANFAETAKLLCAHFEETTGERIVPVLGSTGKLYAQILNGAPFHAFLAADSRRPQLLEEQGRAILGTRFTYALGQLVLWAPEKGSGKIDESFLESGKFGRLAVANPRLAPYGEAARQVLMALGFWERFSGKLIFGENVAQTLHFVDSGNAEAGFVALSQVQGRRDSEMGLWKVPGDLYSPIEQQAVLLRDSPQARRFLEYLKGIQARALIEAAGYLAPPSNSVP